MKVTTDECLRRNLDSSALIDAAEVVDLDNEAPSVRFLISDSYFTLLHRCQS